ASSEMQGKMTAEEQANKPTPAPPPIKSSPVTRPPVSAAKVPIPTGKPPALPLQSNIPISISTAATTQVSVPMVKTSTDMNEERWDEDSFQGLWDSNEDKGLKSDYDLPTSDSSLPSSTISASHLAPMPSHQLFIRLKSGQQIPYGERITLHPEPHERQPFSKEHLGQRIDTSRREIIILNDKIIPIQTTGFQENEKHTENGFLEIMIGNDLTKNDTHEKTGDRRNYGEDRIPISAPTIPRQPPPAPRVERKPESKNVDDILKQPGRESRPERIVIIMRGLPGSGKTHVAKLIRDKEVECGGAAPRVLSLDDYFITEIEKEERDPDTKKRVKKKILEYEYEADMEEVYRASLFKTFKKTLDDGFFPFIILDAINDRVRHFEQFWSAAKTKGFEIIRLVAREIWLIIGRQHPSHDRLDIRSLLQDAAIEEVEMEDFDANIEDQKNENKKMQKKKRANW
ncbi:hypothetical protein E2320_022902, partial [Naja naja]